MRTTQNADYNEGFDDGVSFSQENCVSQDALMQSFDKFLDVINEHKRVLRHVKNHFEGIDVDGVPLKSKKEIEHNIFCIQTMIEVLIKQAILKKDKIDEPTERK